VEIGLARAEVDYIIPCERNFSASAATFIVDDTLMEDILSAISN
jgi:hypothetical protein